MSSRISSAERAVREFLKRFRNWWSSEPTCIGRFIVNRVGCPREQRPEVQWMLKKKWARRVRERSPSGMCRTRQLTWIVLTATGRRAIGLKEQA